MTQPPPFDPRDRRQSPSGPRVPPIADPIPAGYGGLSFNADPPLNVVIAAADTFVIVAGPWVAYAALVDFTVQPVASTLTYTGAESRPCTLYGGCTMQPTVGQDTLGVAIFRNGVLVPSSETQEDVIAIAGFGDNDFAASTVPIVLDPGDVLSLGVVNRDDSTNIRVRHARLQATTLGASPA